VSAEQDGNVDAGAEDRDVIACARRSFERGRASWPDVVLEWDRFERYFVERASGAAPADALAADMYLACASAYGIPRALAALEPLFTFHVARAVASVDASPAFVEDVLQSTREHLLVAAPGAIARIADYAGRASLKSWLSTVAVRRAINHSRREARGRRTIAYGHADLRLVRGSPELDYLRRRYKGAFEDVIRDCIGRLPRQQRLLLRLNLVEGMSIDGLATAYAIGRSTAARRLVQARRELFDGVCRELRTRLKLSRRDLDSLAGEIQSQLDVSILRLLASETRGGVGGSDS
jgi:RNA polymerase sigma-70 factor (ECF subfamily)